MFLISFRRQRVVFYCRQTYVVWQSFEDLGAETAETQNITVSYTQGDHYYTVSQNKTPTQSFCDNFGKCGPIFTGRQYSLLCRAPSHDQVVRLFVRLSVCHTLQWHWVKTTQVRITKSPPTNSARTLVFEIKSSSRKSKGFAPSEGINALNKSGVGKIRNSQPISRRLSRKRCKIRTKLLMMTNMKSHTSFWLVPKSTTLQWMNLNGQYALCCVFRKPPQKLE